MGIFGQIKRCDRARPRSVGFRLARAAATAGIAVWLAACSSSILSEPPTGGSETPERPAAAYPAVHDMPPPRATPLLTKTEQQQSEADLAAARERQSKQSPQKPETAQ